MRHTAFMVRVGLDESLSPALLGDTSGDVFTVVPIPRAPTGEIEVDLWVIPFGGRQLEATFAHLRGVRLIQGLMAGVDGVLPWLPEGVTLCDGRGIHDISTSEWVLSAILAVMKRIPTYRDLQGGEQWQEPGQELVAAPPNSSPDAKPADPPPLLSRVLCEDLAGKRVLIVGYGSIGAAIEARLQPFEVQIDRIARSARSSPEVHPGTELGRLLTGADIVVTILPLTAETRGLMGAAQFGAMKRGALLVNAGRGLVVDTEALVAALQSGHIRAALDVMDPEPLPPRHPLWRAQNCLITPHIAGSTPQFPARAFAFARRQILRFAAGEPLENVVGSAGY